MKEKNKSKDNNNIGKNTKWDSPLKSVKNGATIPKPPVSLNPKHNKTK